MSETKNTTPAFLPSAQAEWEAKIDALKPDDVFVAVMLDPSPLHRHLGEIRISMSDVRKDRRLIEHAYGQTIKRMGEAEIEITLRQPSYSDSAPENAYYRVTGRVVERQAQVLAHGGEPFAVVKSDTGLPIVIPIWSIDAMKVAR